MNFIERLIMGYQARRDARDGVEAKDRRMTATIGLPPAEVARESYAYRNAIRNVSDTGRVDELREDLRRGEDLEAVVGRSWTYTVGLVVVWAVEFAGALLIMRALGLPANHRFLPALALTLALVGLTKVVVKVTTAPHASPPAGAMTGPGGADDVADEEVHREPIEWKRYLLPVALAVFVGAIACVRAAGSDAEDVPPLVAWSEAILMVAISVGPAFAAAWLEKKRAPAAELAHRLTTLRRRLAAEERRIQRAERHLLGVDRAMVKWQQGNARGRAVYSMAHESTLARQRIETEAGGDDETGNDRR